MMKEPSIPAEALQVLAENASALVVRKPAGIPCHPQGKYQQCSLTEILRVSHLKDACPDMGDTCDSSAKPCRVVLEDTTCYLHPVNRLDRQTSGIVLLAKTRKAYMALAQEHGAGLQKLYVAGVCGSFDASVAIERWPQWVERRTTAKGDEEVVCRLPLRVEKHRPNQPLTVVVDTTGAGKSAETMIRQRGESLLCRLETGRTHQIRVHLSAMGFPILGDPVYGTTENEDVMQLHASVYSVKLDQSLDAGKALADILPRPQHVETVWNFRCVLEAVSFAALQKNVEERMLRFLVAAVFLASSAQAAKSLRERLHGSSPCQCQADTSAIARPSRTKPKCIFIDLGAADGNSYNAFLRGEYGQIKDCPNQDRSTRHTWQSISNANDVQVHLINVISLIKSKTIPGDKVLLKVDIEGAEFDLIPCLARSDVLSHDMTAFVEEHYFLGGVKRCLTGVTDREYNDAKQVMMSKGVKMPKYSSITLLETGN
eukprot:s3796_g7.t3